MHRRPVHPYRTQELALLYVAALASSDPYGADVRNIIPDPARFIEGCVVEPPLFFNPEWDALSKQCQICFDVLQLKLRLPKSFELRLMEHWQLDPQKISTVIPYHAIWDQRSLRFFMFVHYHQRSEQAFALPSEPSTLVSYHQFTAPHPRKHGIALGWNPFADGSRPIFVSPLIYKRGDTIRESSAIITGTVSRLTATLCTHSGLSSAARHHTLQPSSTQTRIDVCIVKPEIISELGIRIPLHLMALKLLSTQDTLDKSWLGASTSVHYR